MSTPSDNVYLNDANANAANETQQAQQEQPQQTQQSAVGAVLTPDAYEHQTEVNEAYERQQMGVTEEQQKALTHEVGDGLPLSR